MTTSASDLSNAEEGGELKSQPNKSSNQPANSAAAELPPSPSPAGNPLPAFSRSARYYDLLYREKDYNREAELYGKWLNQSRRSWNYGISDQLIEFGCGTGEFTRRLAAKGWKVTGVDASAEMVELAKSKLADAGGPGEVYCGDLTSRTLIVNDNHAHSPGESVFRHRAWNAACAPFAVMSYASTTFNRFTQSLANVHTALLPGGYFAFDVTHYAAALNTLRRREERIVESDALSIRRRTHKLFNEQTSIVNYEMDFEVLFESGCVDRWQESHKLLAFTPAHLEFALTQAGFRVIATLNMYGEQEITPDDWSFFVVAQKIETRG